MRKRVLSTEVIERRLNALAPEIPPNRVRVKTRHYLGGMLVFLVGAAILAVQLKLIYHRGTDQFSPWLTGIGVVLALVGTTRIDPEIAFSLRANMAVLRGVSDIVLRRGGQPSEE